MAYEKQNFEDGLTLFAKHLNYIEDGIVELEKSLHGSGGNVGATHTFDPTAYGLPVLYLTGDTTGMSKDNAVSLDYVYGERSGVATMKWQGSSSLSYPKKNYTIKFDNAFEAATGWGEQKKYCLKANYIDHSHARNLVSAKLWGEIVKTRIQSVTGVSSGGTVNPNAYSLEGDVIIANATTQYGNAYIKEFVIPAGDYKISLDVFFPDGASNLKIATQFFRLSTNVGVNYVDLIATKTGEWETLTGGTHWGGGSDALIMIMPTVTNGVKIRNIRMINIYNESVFYDFKPASNPLKNSINGGAVDGFPCIVMLNREFHGLYTFNIPKDGWMFGMNDSTVSQAILCANTQNNACGFKALATLTDDFDLEYVSDEENSDWVLTSLNNLIGAVINSDGTDLDTTVAKFLDWHSAIDYLIFTVLLRGTDMFRKNYLLVTYDGVKWFFSAYDMDSTYGMKWDGKGFDSANGYPFLNDYNHRVMELIYTYKKDELLARYEEIRNTVMSEDNVYQKFTNFASVIPSPVLVEDVKLWPTIPSSSASNTAQILNWYRLRSAFIDKQAGQM